MSAGANTATRTYNVQSPGDGVYRVRLFERSGDGSAELFFTGDRDEHTAELRPGDYWAIVVDVAAGTASGRIPVTLGPADRPLTLSQPADAKSAAAKPAGQPVLRASTGAALDQRSSTLAWQKSDVAETFIPGAAMTAPVRRFDIGISEDHAPGSTGAWRAPEELEVQATFGDSSEGLQIRIRDGQPGRKSRVRMSIGIEGLSTIRVPLPLYRRGLVVTIRPAPAGEDELDVLVEVTAVDPKVQALVAALAELSSGEAMSVLDWAAGGNADHAIAFLADKAEDLWAATAAAVLLVKIGQFDSVAAWLGNLARLAPHIADASIVAAWGIVADNSEAGIETVEREAMHLLARAGRVGAPNYSVANSLNLELLSSLHATAVSREVRDDAAKVYERATQRSRFRLFKSPYMIWEEAREQLQGGRLPGALSVRPLYLPVARGTLGSDGLTAG